MAKKTRKAGRKAATKVRRPRKARRQQVSKFEAPHLDIKGLSSKEDEARLGLERLAAEQSLKVGDVVMLSGKRYVIKDQSLDEKGAMVEGVKVAKEAAPKPGKKLRRKAATKSKVRAKRGK
jgi:uncharacterized membrane protein